MTDKLDSAQAVHICQEDLGKGSTCKRNTNHELPRSRLKVQQLSTPQVQIAASCVCNVTSSGLKAGLLASHCIASTKLHPIGCRHAASTAEIARIAGHPPEPLAELPKEVPTGLELSS